MIKIATWNINSVKAHSEVLKRWLHEAQPDVLCLQEIKCETQNFPNSFFEEMGYSATVQGQKSYNGVALLSRHRAEDIITHLPGDGDDDQARYVQASFIIHQQALTVASLYLPNGNPVEGPKFPYKLSWMERLHQHAANLLQTEEAFILAGDYNVIAQNRDAKNPNQWQGDALFQPASRQAYQGLLNLGLTEAFGSLYPTTKDHYSFYDYQAGAWQKGNGIRIDHLLLSPQAANSLKEAQIDAHVRGWDKPSDHVPVMAILS